MAAAPRASARVAARLALPDRAAAVRPRADAAPWREHTVPGSARRTQFVRRDAGWLTPLFGDSAHNRGGSAPGPAPPSSGRCCDEHRRPRAAITARESVRYGLPGSPRLTGSRRDHRLFLDERFEVLTRVVNVPDHRPLPEQLVGDIAEEAHRQLVVEIGDELRSRALRFVADDEVGC